MKIYTIGGYDEVGKNMTAVEVNDEIIILDMGFYLPKLLNYEEGDPRDLSTKDLIKIGVLPDDTILESKKDKVKAIILGHCHLDHIGAAPYLAGKYNCPVFGTPYTIGLTQTLFDERDLEFKAITLNFGARYKITENIELEFVGITHSTVQTALIVLRTKEGTVVYANDFKLDSHPVVGKKPDFERMEEIGKEGVKVLILDSLKSNNEMKTPSEKVAREMLKDVIAGVQNTHNSAIVVTTFSSHIARLKSIIDFGKSLNRKVVFLGRSLFKYVSIAQDLKLINFRNNVEMVGYRRLVEKKLSEISKSPEKYLIACTGNQGEKDSILSKMTHNELPWKFKANDIVIFSCRTIPTPETIENREYLEKCLKDKHVRIFKNIHVSGHGSSEDHRDLLTLLKPKNIIPSHGPYEIVKGMEELALSIGYKKNKTLHIMKNGKVLKL